MTDTVVELKTFIGLNIRDSPHQIADTQLSDVENFDLGASGELKKRTGFQQKHDGATLGANPIHILGFFNTGTYKQFIARAGINLYTSTDSIVWTIITGGPWGEVECGVQYTDKFYMVRKSGTVITWDGAAVSAVAGSPTGTYCKVYKDRLFVVDSSATGVNASRLRFSEPFDFTTTGWPSTNYIGVTEGDGDWLVAVYNVQDTLYIFKSTSTQVLYVQGSEPLAWIMRPFDTSVGCISKYSIVPYEGQIFFASATGVFITNGPQFKLVSSPVGPYFDSVVVDVSTLNIISAVVWEDKYIITLPAFVSTPLWSEFNVKTWNQLSSTLWSGGSTEAVTLVYHILQDGWTRWKFTGLNPHIFISVYATTTLKGVYCGDRSGNGKVYKYGIDQYLDVSFTYLARFDTKVFDFGNPTQKKRGKWVGISILGPGYYEARSICDSDRIIVTPHAGVVNEVELKNRGPGYFRTWKFNVRHLSSNYCTVFGFTLYMLNSGYRPVRDSS